MAKDLRRQIEAIARKDGRYRPDAYEFVMRALHFTQNKLKRKGHVTGRELSEGIRDFALEQFGSMAALVLEHWGVRNTGDFGEIVFNMIECGLMRKTEDDSPADFRDVYDFKEAFEIDDRVDIR
jgi:uncharacterized repeat protein (TIGR04138 family)